MEELDLADLRHHKTYHNPASPGREFTLQVTTTGGRLIRAKNRQLMPLIARLLLWGQRAKSVRICDFEGAVIVSPQMAGRIRNAARGRYGTATPETPFVVYGPTLNPTHLVDYWTVSLLKAIDFAIYWVGSSWDDPYWVRILGPDKRIVLTKYEIYRMFRLAFRASGGTIIESVILADGSPLGKVISQRRIA